MLIRAFDCSWFSRLARSLSISLKRGLLSIASVQQTSFSIQPSVYALTASLNASLASRMMLPLVKNVFIRVMSPDFLIGAFHEWLPLCSMYASLVFQSPP